jgi:hypothetical protein
MAKSKAKRQPEQLQMVSEKQIAKDLGLNSRGQIWGRILAYE